MEPKPTPDQSVDSDSRGRGPVNSANVGQADSLRRRCAPFAFFLRTIPPRGRRAFTLGV